MQIPFTFLLHPKPAQNTRWARRKTHLDTWPCFSTGVLGRRLKRSYEKFLHQLIRNLLKMLLVREKSKKNNQKVIFFWLSSPKILQRQILKEGEKKCLIRNSSEKLSEISKSGVSRPKNVKLFFQIFIIFFLSSTQSMKNRIHFSRCLKGL